MEAILIYRNLSDPEIHSVKKKFSEGAKIFTGPNYLKQDELGDVGINPISLDANLKKEVFQQLKEEILAFGDKKIGDKTFKEILSADNISIWHYHRFRIFYQIQEAYFTINEINNYAIQFDELSVFNYENFDPSINKSIPPNVTFFGGKQVKNGINFRSLINYVITASFRSFIGFFQNFRITSKKKHIIISNPISENAYLNRVSLKEEVDDVVLGYLMQDTDDSFLFLDDISIPKLKAKDTFKLKRRYFFNSKKRAQLNSDFILSIAAFTPGVHRQLKSAMRSIRTGYAVIEKEKLEDTDQLIFQTIKKLDSSSKYFLFRYFAFINFFKKHLFDTITTKNENAPNIKTILDAAKTQNTITIGVQHGAITEYNMEYELTKDDLKNKPIPDFTLMWGDDWKKEAVENKNYPESSIITIGQIRTDVIPALNKADKSVLFPNLSDESSVIVFATQPQPNAIQKKRATEEVFTAVKDLDNVLLLLKLHPRETNENYYHQIAKDVGCKNYLITHNDDLYKVIAVCDILITCFSTVGGETIYFDKPLITLDHLKMDICGYHRAKVAFQVTNEEELNTTIINILDGTLKIDQNAYNDYKKNYAYKIDGGVSKRCLEFIKNFEKPN